MNAAAGGILDVTDVLRRLARLRLAVAAVVVVALVAAGVAYLSADSSRQSRAAVVIVPPKVADVAGGDNPLLSLDNNLAQLAVVLSGTLGSASVSRALARDGATAEFSVSSVTGDNPSFSQLTPQLIFTVTGADDDITRRTAAALIEQSGVALAALQDRAGVPATSRASVVEVSAPTPPVAVAGGRLRSAGALGVGIVVLGLVLILAVDALRRRSRDASASRPPVLDGLRERFGSRSTSSSRTRPASRPQLSLSKPQRPTIAEPTSPAVKTPAVKTPAVKTPPVKTSAAKKTADRTAAGGASTNGASTNGRSSNGAVSNNRPTGRSSRSSRARRSGG